MKFFPLCMEYGDRSQENKVLKPLGDQVERKHLPSCGQLITAQQVSAYLLGSAQPVGFHLLQSLVIYIFFSHLIFFISSLFSLHFFFSFSFFPFSFSLSFWEEFHFQLTFRMYLSGSGLVYLCWLWGLYSMVMLIQKYCRIMRGSGRHESYYQCSWWAKAVT